jgi:outer membrane lipoprotein SlyB
MKILLMAVIISLTGCANKLAFVGDHFDRYDPCQTQEFSRHTGSRLKPEGYQPPAACGGASRQTIGVIRNNSGNQTAIITTR